MRRLFSGNSLMRLRQSGDRTGSSRRLVSGLLVRVTHHLKVLKEQVSFQKRRGKCVIHEGGGTGGGYQK
jgi:hypothetical protein